MRTTILWNAVGLVLAVGACGEDGRDLTPGDEVTEVADAADADGTEGDEVPPETGGDEGGDAVEPDESIDDGGGPSASVTGETGYPGSVSCSSPAIAAASPSDGVAVVTLLQIPADAIRGTCAGHWVANEGEMISGRDILIILDGSTGSTCWTACWDFEVTITGLPPGMYSVSLAGTSLRASVTVGPPSD